MQIHIFNKHSYIIYKDGLQAWNLYEEVCTLMFLGPLIGSSNVTTIAPMPI